MVMQNAYSKHQEEGINLMSGVFAFLLSVAIIAIGLMLHIKSRGLSQIKTLCQNHVAFKVEINRLLQEISVDPVQSWVASDPLHAFGCN